MTGGTARLVRTGYCNGNQKAPINLYVYYTIEQSKSKNQSTIYCGMYVEVSGYNIGPWDDFYVESYVGTTSNKFNGSIPNFSGTRWLVENKSFTVDHNDDGTGTATIYWKWGINSPWGRLESPEGYFNVSLETIERASEVTANDITLGDPCNIKWTPTNSSYKYKINLSLGNWSAVIPSSSSYISPGKTSVYTYSDYTIPASEIYNQLPNSDYGNMTITLETYSSGGTKIGTSNPSTFKVTIPDDVRPTVGAITLTPETISLSSGSTSLLVKGKNKLGISVTGSSPGSGSSIKSYKFSGQNISITSASSSITSSGTINPTIKNGSMTLTYIVTVTDNRDRSSSESATIVCYDYVTPTFTHFNAYKTDSSGNAINNGTYLRCDYTITYSSVNNTNQISSLVINYGSNTKSYTTGWSTSSNNGLVTASGNVIFSIGSSTSSFNVYATVTDKYKISKKSSTDSVYEERIFNVYPDGKSIAFGKMAEQSNLFECQWPAKFNDTLTAQYGRFVSTGDAEPSTQNAVPLRVGLDSGLHIDFDNNEIIAKNNASSSGPLYITGQSIGLYNGTHTTCLFKVGEDDTGGYVQSLPTYNRSYNYSSNMYITSSGTFGRSSSSSKRYKTDISDVNEESLNPYSILDIPVRQFKYNKDNIPINKDIDDLYIGFIAEEVEQAYPSAAEYNENGQVEMWNIKVIVPAMLKIIQDQQKVISELQTEVQQLKSKI